MKRIALGAIGAVLALSAAGCSSSDPVADASASVSEASSAYCSQLATTEAAASELESLASNPSATVDQIKAQRQEVKADLSDLASEAENLGTVQKAANQTLIAAYDTAVQNIPGDATVQEAGTQLEAATKALATALAQVKQSASC